MSIDKKALFKLKSEPYLKPISDLGVGFYNLDKNTATLRFQLSNSKGPLLIDKHNMMAYAFFESSNGSVSDVFELKPSDGMNGIVEITLDKEFLQASTSTTVKGQLYIAVNNVDNQEINNQTAVFREFKFEVADALINKISSFTKVEHIRMFDQLKQQIQQRVNDIEEAIKNGDDYVAEMENALESGKKEINQSVNTGKTDIETITENSKKDIEKTKTETTESIESKSSSAISAVNYAKDTATTEMNESVTTVESAKNDVLKAIDTGDFVKSKDHEVAITKLEENKANKNELEKYATTIQLNNKADKSDLDKKADKSDLDSKANTTDLNKKANQADVDESFKNLNGTMENFVEHGFLNLEKGFENYYNPGEKEDAESTFLQYTRIGSLCHIFGIVKNTVRLEVGSANSVAVMPKHLKVISRDVKVAQGSENNTFTTIILSDDNPNYANTITMERLRDDNGNNIAYEPNRFLNISLTCTVEVVE